jgi:hypothetical protein
MRKTYALFAAGFVLASIVGVTTFPQAAASESEDVELRIVGRTTEQSFLDLGEAGPSLGDEFIFRDVLKRDGERVGHDGGVCTVTSTTTGAQGEFQCVVTLWLPEGQITTQALVVMSEESPVTFDVAVTGGTGRYEEADGEAHVTEVSETVARLTIHLHL